MAPSKKNEESNSKRELIDELNAKAAVIQNDENVTVNLFEPLTYDIFEISVNYPCEPETNIVFTKCCKKTLRLRTPYFLEKVSAKTGLTIPEVRESFSESFWAEITEQELNRLYAELFERVILKEDQLIYDIKTSGVQNLIEGVMQ